MAYSTAPTILVDDLLSSLDDTTSQRIFLSLFGSDGLFAKQQRTVILATRIRRVLISLV